LVEDEIAPKPHSRATRRQLYNKLNLFRRNTTILSPFQNVRHILPPFTNVKLSFSFTRFGPYIIHSL
jgi:hypothetical protein